MATALKQFGDSWVDLPAPTSVWKRQASSGHLVANVHDETIVIKRAKKRRDISSFSEPTIWDGLLRQTRIILPANRDDPNHAAIEKQVDELREYALEEGLDFSNASADAGLTFCHSLAADFEPSIFLLANGNIRAMWRNGARDQIGIQFMPNGLLQYVILRDRDGLTLKALGEDLSQELIQGIVEVHGLMGLWFCGQG